MTSIAQTRFPGSGGAESRVPPRQNPPSEQIGSEPNRSANSATRSQSWLSNAGLAKAAAASPLELLFRWLPTSDSAA